MELMDMLPFLLGAVAGGFASFILSLILKSYLNQTKENQVPESGGAWPIIGHLSLLESSRLPPKVLATMADT